jgi:hypothetical protein
MNPVTDELWETFCRLRLESKAYRAADDPVVRQAHETWERAFEAETGEPEKSNVIQFRKAGSYA